MAYDDRTLDVFGAVISFGIVVEECAAMVKHVAKNDDVFPDVISDRCDRVLWGDTGLEVCLDMIVRDVRDGVRQPSEAIFDARNAAHTALTRLYWLMPDGDKGHRIREIIEDTHKRIGIFCGYQREKLISAPCRALSLKRLCP